MDSDGSPRQTAAEEVGSGNCTEHSGTVGSAVNETLRWEILARITERSVRQAVTVVAVCYSRQRRSLSPRSNPGNYTRYCQSIQAHPHANFSWGPLHFRGTGSTPWAFIASLPERQPLQRSPGLTSAETPVAATAVGETALSAEDCALQAKYKSLLCTVLRGMRRGVM